MKKFIAFALLFLVFVSGTSFGEVKRNKISDGPHGENCVEFARTEVPSLPRNLFTFDAKKKIINNNKPKKGSVAIIDVGNSVGHVAVVIKVDDDGKKQGITLKEANFPSRGVWKRTAESKNIKDAERELKIVGYFRP